jgi:cytochrome c oxidase subunit 1
MFGGTTITYIFVNISFWGATGILLILSIYIFSTFDFITFALMFGITAIMLRINSSINLIVIIYFNLISIIFVGYLIKFVGNINIILIGIYLVHIILISNIFFFVSNIYLIHIILIGIHLIHIIISVIFGNIFIIFVIRIIILIRLSIYVRIYFIRNNIEYYVCPLNLSYYWNNGFVLFILLSIQLISGIILSSLYSNTYSYNSINNIMREVNLGYIFRYLHCNIASMIFVIVYIHIIRSIYFMSYYFIYYCWISGIIIYFILMIIGFVGYILPFGQMSFWGATVIFSLLSFIPFIIEWIYGSYLLLNICIYRLLIIHFILSILIIIPLIIHVLYLHYCVSSSNIIVINYYIISFYHYIFKDIFFIILIFIGLISNIFISLSNHINGIDLNGFITPLHILPEWYFLSYYAILKCVPNKYCGLFCLIMIFIICTIYIECINNKYYLNFIIYHNYTLYINLICITFIILTIIGIYLPLNIYITYSLLYYLFIIYLLYISIISLTITSLTILIRLSINFIYKCNNKRIGIIYLIISILYSVSGIISSLIIRYELYNIGNRIIEVNNILIYSVYISYHGIIMIFYFVMPSLFGGYGNYLYPLCLGIIEVYYPRINILSIILLIISFVSFIYNIFSEYGSTTGWTIYPPLSTSLMNLCPLSVDFIIIGLLINGISSMLSSINYIIIFSIYIREYIFSYNLFILSILITSYMLIIVLPIISGLLILLILDLNFNSCYFDPIFHGEVLYFEHLFWLFGHPEVYILILPAFGLISIIIMDICCKLIFGIHSMIIAMINICLIGIIVWGHHMFNSGLFIDSLSYFMSLTIIISLPTGTKIFNWLCSILFIYIFNYNIIFVLIFNILFTFGGTTGIILGNSSIDISLHDTYYVVAHFHLVLSVSILLVFIGYLINIFDILFNISSIIYINIFGNMFNLIYIILPISFISTLFILSLSISILLIFVPMHFLGFNVIPRRIPDYSYYTFNSISSISSYMFISILILPLLFKLLYNIFTINVNPIIFFHRYIISNSYIIFRSIYISINLNGILCMLICRECNIINFSNINIFGIILMIILSEYMLIIILSIFNYFYKCSSDICCNLTHIITEFNLSTLVSNHITMPMINDIIMILMSILYICSKLNVLILIIFVDIIFDEFNIYNCLHINYYAYNSYIYLLINIHYIHIIIAIHLIGIIFVIISLFGIIYFIHILIGIIFFIILHLYINLIGNIIHIVLIILIGIHVVHISSSFNNGIIIFVQYLNFYGIIIYFHYFICNNSEIHMLFTNTYSNPIESFILLILSIYILLVLIEYHDDVVHEHLSICCLSEIHIVFASILSIAEVCYANLFFFIFIFFNMTFWGGTFISGIENIYFTFLFLFGGPKYLSGYITMIASLTIIFIILFFILFLFNNSYIILGIMVIYNVYNIFETILNGGSFILIYNVIINGMSIIVIKILCIIGIILIYNVIIGNILCRINGMLINIYMFNSLICRIIGIIINVCNINNIVCIIGNIYVVCIIDNICIIVNMYDNIIDNICIINICRYNIKYVIYIDNNINISPTNILINIMYICPTNSIVNINICIINKCIDNIFPIKCTTTNFISFILKCGPPIIC